ncbi:hypothetical protein ACJ41O_010656 [Fusarium nematophilum]
MPNPFAGNLVWLSSLLNPGPRQVRSAIGRPYNANFERFLDISSKEGTDGYGNRVPFISRKALEGYWLDDLDECRISHALSSKVLVSERDISEDYLIIFSILIHIGRTEFIDQFAEIGFMGKHLPIMRRHPFGGSPAVQEMADEFYHYQWRFCPVLFLSENRSVGRGLQPIIFKEYLTQKNLALEDAWRREVQAFQFITWWDHVVKYIGSFTQQSRCVIVLEYA